MPSGADLYICEDGLVHWCSQQRDSEFASEVHPDAATGILTDKFAGQDVRTCGRDRDFGQLA